MIPAAFFDPLLPLAPALDPVLDPLIIRGTRSLLSLWKGPPLRVAQARARELALVDVLSRHRPAIEAIAERMASREPAIVATYDALVSGAVDDLRGRAQREASREFGQRFAHMLDRATYDNRDEWLDDPAFDRTLRVRTLERLDRINEAIGSYQAFFSAVTPLVESARSAGVERPVVVDLASGHAMFSVALALRLGAREGRVRVIASDLVPEFLEIGRAHALRIGLDEDAVSFMEQDVLDLRDLSAKIGAPVDVICCTQTLHHFTPGFISRMLGEAAKVARHGAVFADGERNAFALPVVATVAGVIGRGNLPFLHDAFVSMRRMFTEQELALMSALAPRGDGRVGLDTERGWEPPGQIWVRVR